MKVFHKIAVFFKVWLPLQKIYGLYDLKHHIVEISRHVTDVGQGNILLFIDVINKQD